jgi:hypothetical protein
MYSREALGIAAAGRGLTATPNKITYLTPEKQILFFLKTCVEPDILMKVNSIQFAIYKPKGY